MTRQKLQKLEREGDCSPNDTRKFFRGVRQFYEAAVEYIIAKFPLTDELLLHARFVDFENRESAEFKNVEYFMTRYIEVLAFDLKQVDKVYDEFVAYQMLEKSDIPESVWELANERSKDEDDEDDEGHVHVRMDVIWAYLSRMRTDDNCHLKLPLLSKVAKLVLTLPHSNAGEERVFSLIRLNKTPYRSSLSLDGTLSSILTIKMHNPEPCFDFEPSEQMLEKSKKATWNYNKQHRK